MSLDALAEALDALVVTGGAALADPESLLALERELARLESVVASAASAFDAGGAWALDGAKSPVAWLATAARLPKAEARRRMRRGSALHDLPATRAAWEKGALGGAHVDVLAARVRPATAEALARDEAMLVEMAGTLSFSAFARAVAYWEQLADPDGSETQAERRTKGRRVYLEAGFGGSFLGQITLDPISGAIVTGELERLEALLFDDDWAAAREALGRDPTSADLARTGPQRRADALVEMATRSATAPANGRPPAPLFSVLVDVETLAGRVCELAEGIVVAPGDLVRWLTRADIERAVFTPKRRVEVGARTRLFSGATRRAVELRDRECTHPFCDRPAPSCQVDHIVPFTEGGPTTQENGRLLCPFHNRLAYRERPPPDG